jgi:hypothetical protein
MFIIDDADSILKLRHETKLMRMSNSINKTQRIISERLTGRIESLVDKMIDLSVFEIEEGKEEDEEEEETK